MQTCTGYKLVVQATVSYNANRRTRHPFTINTCVSGYLEVALVSGEVEGGTALQIKHINPGVVCEERGDRLHVTMVASDQQRRPADHVLSVQRLRRVRRTHVRQHL